MVGQSASEQALVRSSSYRDQRQARTEDLQRSRNPFYKMNMERRLPTRRRRRRGLSNILQRIVRSGAPAGSDGTAHPYCLGNPQGPEVAGCACHGVSARSGMLDNRLYEAKMMRKRLHSKLIHVGGAWRAGSSAG